MSVLLQHEPGELYRLLVASVHDYAIFILDPQGNVATWNAGAQRIKGYTADEIIGRHFSTFYPQEDIDAGKCKMELAVASRVGRFEDEGWRLRKDGTRFWANVVISAVRDRDGTLVGFSKVTRDLTERRAAEDDRAARLAAEHASRTKDEFLAMLGHELRNPLAPIVTALQLLKMRGGEVTREHEIIERQVAHMTRLVDDLLDVSRIARGKFDLKRKHLDLRDVVAKSIETAGPLFEQRQQQIDVHAPMKAVIVDADEARLAQVFTNLLTNAAKYSNHGGHIEVSLEQRDGTAVVTVKDTGQGIDPELLPRVFDLFVQGYQSVERSTGGLGLGLTLVRSLVAMHGGSVEAHSPGRGHGSTFTVHLPAISQATEPVPRADSLLDVPRVETKKRVLVVDDNEDARILLSELLTAMGHDVRTANDGPDALRQIAAFPPDVAVLDIGLPVMDGYELAERLRAVLAKTPLFIALSGYGAPTDQDRSKTAGFDQHLVKPVDVRKLLESIGD